MKNGSKLFVLMLLVGMLSCNRLGEKPMFLPLEEFSVKNQSLCSIVRNTFGQLKIDTCEEVAVLDLIYFDNQKMYFLSFQQKKDLVEDYICWNNRRIVGYSEIDGYLTIILSNVDNHRDFLDLFASDLNLCKDVREYSFMCIPKTRYHWSTEDGETLSWQDKGILYEPVFLVIKPNAKGSYSTSWTNSPFREISKIPNATENYQRE